MATLHAALDTLQHVDYADVPLNDLSTFLRSVLAAGEVICNSVPPPPGGTDFASSSPTHKSPNSAACANDIIHSSARPPPPIPEHADLQKAWGKPLKISAKENPLGISVYKMAGHDRHGAWFARRSVHEGIGFKKFMKAMQREFPDSLAVQGGPGEGSIRGLTGDRRLEVKEVDGVGKMEVYQLSAQFPGPTTPREFLTLLVTSDAALTEASAVEVEGGKRKALPRHYMVVSRPTKHVDAPERTGYIRGHYESVEMIRELPLNARRSASTTNLLDLPQSPDRGRTRGSTIGFAESRGPSAKGERLDRHEEPGRANDPELNPVEWIMVTRSDPGGGIPRFMVERGSPGAIAWDTVKFFNWACGKDELPDSYEDADKQTKASLQIAETHNASAAGITAPQTNGHLAGISTTAPPTPTRQQGGRGGIFSALTSAVESYAPAPVASYAHSYLHPEQSHEPLSSSNQTPHARDISPDSSDSSSTNSFASAEEGESDAPVPPAMGSAAASIDNLSLTSTFSSPESALTSNKNLSPQEKEILKISQQRQKLEEKLAKKRTQESEKLKSVQSKEQADIIKARERHEREMKKTEEKHQKELQKLQERKEKEERKLEQKRQKALDRDALAKVTRERDESRNQVDLLRKENQLLKDQVRTLQKENTLLVQRLGRTGGETAVRAVREEAVAGRKRATSMRSNSSMGSGEKGKELTGGQG
ncbi:hypothetical protein LTR50_005451 [Elasticomyces elasticus]|nr:hypothetical protein LTR50_005451 [Elasticomyces elasticus]